MKQTSRMFVWLLVVAMSTLGYVLGQFKLGTIFSSIYFSAMALVSHWLCGPDARADLRFAGRAIALAARLVWAYLDLGWTYVRLAIRWLVKG